MDDLVVVPPFNYQELDQDTEAFLRQKESNILNIVHKTSTELGKELKEAQDKLAQHGYGCFEEWYTSLGLKKQSVYNYINYHSLIVQQLDKRELIESLPKPVAYEIAKPTVTSEIKAQVLAGEITTTKQLQEAIKARKEAEVKAAKLEKELSEAKSQPPETVEKEVIPADYEILKSENKKLREETFQAKSKLMQKEEEEKDRFTKAKLNKKALDQEFHFLLGKINLFLKDVFGYVFLANELINMEPSKAKEHETALSNLEEWLSQMKNALPPKGKTINIEGVICQ